MEINKEFYEWLKKLYAVDELQGYTDEDIAFLREKYGALPRMLELFYRTAGKTEAFHHVQDTWILYEHYAKRSWLGKSGYLIILDENQGVCRAGIRPEDMTMYDPPVYVTEDDKNWSLCAGSVSEFLAAALAYESVFTFDEYSPDNLLYWMSEDDYAIVRDKLTKLPFEMHGWVGDADISFYSNASGNIVVVMECSGEYQLLYGASGEEAYEKLMSVMDGIGEPM